MLGYYIFMNVFSNLSNNLQKSILRKIFLLDDVSVFSVVQRNNSVIFRIYSNSVFCQYIFMYDKADDNNFFEVNYSDRMVCYNIHLFSYVLSNKDDSICYLIKMLLSSSELFIYQLFPYFL